MNLRSPFKVKMKIITITLNPAFDIHCGVEKFIPEHENHMKDYERNIGGKGVNISRALHANGIESTAFVVLGKENAADFESDLVASGIKYVPFYVDGRIRENITVHPDLGKETRISFEGCRITESSLVDVFDNVLPLCDEETIATFNGRMPTGLSVADVAPYLEKIKAKGAKLVIDSSSFSIEDFALIKPWLIKPNQEEISDCTGREIKTAEDAICAARDIHEKGIDNVIVSLGGDGAVLVSDEVECAASVPRVKAISTIGAGDSSVAGFCAAYILGKSKEECLASAVSYGTAACLTSGTLPLRKEDVESISKEVKIKTI